MNAKEIVALADKHKNTPCEMPSSADLCLADAHHWLGLDNEQYAKAHALSSLRYRIGIYHPDFKAAVEVVVPDSSADASVNDVPSSRQHKAMGM